MAESAGKQSPRQASAKPNWVFQLTMKIDETALAVGTSLELGQKAEEVLGKVGKIPMLFKSIRSASIVEQFPLR